MVEAWAPPAPSKCSEKCPRVLISRRDVDFLLFEWLDVARLTERQAFADHSRQTFDAALDTPSEIAHAEFAPHNKKVDREPRGW